MMTTIALAAMTAAGTAFSVWMARHDNQNQIIHYLGQSLPSTCQS